MYSQLFSSGGSDGTALSRTSEAVTKSNPRRKIDEKLQRYHDAYSESIVDLVLNVLHVSQPYRARLKEAPKRDRERMEVVMVIEYKSI